MTGRKLLGAVWVPLLCVNALALAAAPDPGPSTPLPSQAHHRHHYYRHHFRHHYYYRTVSSGPRLRSSEVLVLDETHSKVLYARRADIPQPIASISKLMTAMVVLDARLPLDQVLEITPADRAIGRGAYDRLEVGTRLTRTDLLHLALMASENRAAHALGRNYPGGIQAFVLAMNAKARALGMRTAHFVEPTGLSSDNVASPDDLAKMVAAAAKYPLIREYSTAHHYTVWVGAGRRRHLVEFGTTDPLVASPSWKIVVQKTGFIDPAGKCLVMQAVIDHRTVVMVLLHSWGRYTRVADARRVRQWVKARFSASARALRTGHSTA